MRLSGASNRSIFLSNVISFITVLILILLSILHFLFAEDRMVFYVILPQILIFSFVPVLNSLLCINLSRYVLILTFVFGTLGLTISRKLDGVLTESTFFVGRSAIVVFSALLPIAVFHLSEKTHLIANLILSFCAWALYDPIHNFLGIGFYQSGHSSQGYYYNNILFFIIYIAIISIIWYLKATLEAYEARNKKNIKILDEKNNQIQKQNEDLEEKNSILINLLNKQEEDVATINQELVRKNSELVNFSYAISHNLRGPVASLLGLVELIKNGKNGELGKYVNGIDKSAKTLDQTVRDLSALLDVNNIYHPERIILEEELNEIASPFQNLLEKEHINLITELNVKEVFSVRPFVTSIISQLISNAIKYRMPDKNTVIFLRTRMENNFVCLEVEDNGTGISMETHKANLFKPFKRFHEKSGKGLGLYLVKLQVDKLGGKIDVKSRPGVGSIFTVYL
jgi:signal transduction histidine kinase